MTSAKEITSEYQDELDSYFVFINELPQSHKG